MGSVKIENLHSELLGRVCQYLDETHPPSLLAFSQVSKYGYAIASRFLFRTIKFTISDRRQLVHDVKKWETLLLRENGFRHVRRLILYCSTEDAEERHDGYLSLDPCERYEDDSGLRTCWDLYHHNFFPFDEDSIPVDERTLDIANGDWEAVAHLTKQLAGLADLFFACPVEFPTCLLETLHAGLRRCRLHHYNFRLSSLDKTSIDPSEMALASSPCLVSIGDVNLASDSIAWDYVRHQASRMKEAHLWLPEDNASDFGAEDRGWRWPGVDVRPPKSLEYLHLNSAAFHHGPASFRTVSWAVDGVFSSLRVLKLDLTFTHLDGLPAPKDFPVLETLVFTCARAPSMQYWSVLLNFLHHLPRLTTLRLREWARSVSFVPGLNPNLRYLYFSTRVETYGEALNDDHIHQLADVCPDLEDLVVEIRRSQGTAREVSLYRALGHLRRLRNLTLNLDASPPGLDSTVEFLDQIGDSISHGTVIEPWFDAEDARTLDGPLRPYRRGHIRDALVNSAIDSDLARSIFEVVNETKAELPGPVLPLERLELETRHGERFQQAGRWSPQGPIMLPFLAALQRRWLVKRDVRDDARDILHVTEMDREARLKSSSREGNYLTRKRNEYLFQNLFDVWQHVWPSEEEGSIRWQHWKSLPLAGDY